MGQIKNIFQIDSDLVKKVYKENNNYLIEYDNHVKSKVCAIYFSSNDIYFPNTEEVFKERILKKNIYEWYKCRIREAHKHIFIRDILKQWYLKGINAHINNHEKLLNLLKNETNGHQVITIGSSAGGYAAILYGSLLNAIRIIVTNPQFEIYSLLKDSKEIWNPLVFRFATNPQYNKLYDITPYLTEESPIYYFYSNRSLWDCKQYSKVKNNPYIKIISFNTSHHGIPFLKVALNKTINLSPYELNELSLSVHSPILFTISKVGLWTTCIGLLKQIKLRLKKLIIIRLSQYNIHFKN